MLPVDASSFLRIIDVSVQFSPAEKTQMLSSYQEFWADYAQVPGLNLEKGADIDYYTEIKF